MTPRSTLTATCLALFFLTGCSEDPGSQPDAAGTGRDAGKLYGTVIHMADGQTVQGELLHVYDMRRSVIPCDAACPHLVYALFDSSRYSENRDLDQSIQFACVDPNDSSISIDTYPPEPGTLTFAEFRRQHGLSFTRLPLDGVWFVHEGNSGYHLDEGGAGDFAWDFVMLRNGTNGADPANDIHCVGAPGACNEIAAECTGGSSNHDYYAWQRCVRVPSPGTVSVVSGTHGDHCPHGEANFPNYVFIDLSGGYRLLLTHLAQNSVQVGRSESVDAGALLGRIGNSGLSFAPHLHASLFWHGKDTPENCQGGWSVPSDFQELYAKAASSAREQTAARQVDYVPARGEFVSTVPFTINENAPLGECEP